MLNRRGFLTRSGLALGALVVGDEVLEAFARLTHVRKSFPSAGIPGVDTPMTASAVLEGWRYVQVTADLSVSLTAAIAVLQGSHDGRYFTPLQMLPIPKTGGRVVFPAGHGVDRAIVATFNQDGLWATVGPE